MERSIRIGKDFNVRWSIKKVVDGERQPYVLAGKELVLQYRTPYGIKEATEWKVVGNTIVWTFRGKEQKALGSYELILTENGGKDGMVTVDTRRAFKLVAHSCEETEGSGCDIVIEDVVLESEVAFAPVVTQGDDTDIWEALASQEQLIEDLQNMKIDREADDYYPKLSVGLADNLAGVDVVDSEINFRRSGGGAISDGVARIESIKGNSVVWNQCFGKGATTLSQESWDGLNGRVTINGSLPSVQSYDTASRGAVSKFPIGHKVFVVIRKVSGKVVSGGVRTYVSSLVAGNNVLINPDSTNVFLAHFGTIAADASFHFYRDYLSNSVFENLVLQYEVHDLTQMFGAGNEPTTIEEFYQRIPMGVDLNAYNEGEVIHMDVQSIESQGVNAWDEQWRQGYYENGKFIAFDAFVANENLLQVISNETYYYSAPEGITMSICYYDNEEAYIGEGLVFSNTTFTIPANVSYINFRFGSDYGSTYNHDICISLSDTSVNGKYYPYIKRVEDLAVIRKYFPDGMKSAGSAHDEIRYNKASGKWEKVVRIGEVDMADLTLYYNAGNEGCFYGPLNGAAKHLSWAKEGNLLSAPYTTTNGNAIVQSGVTPTDKTLAIAPNGNIYVVNKTYTDVASFKAAMQGVILYYELAEPIVTELDEADQFKDLDYQVWNAGTEKAIAKGKSAPLAADITYGFNAIGKIKELESLVAALRAKVGI